MPQYQVPIQGPGGSGAGTITVNASDPVAAAINAQQGGNTVTGNPSQIGGNPPSASPTVTTNNNSSAVQQLGQQINSLLGAIASGNKDAFNEAVRQFDLTFGLDRDKFNEAIRQFNANLGIAEAGLTGFYQGQATLPAQMGAIQTAAALQANPFRQAQVIGQLGGLLRGTGVAGFQAPGQAQGQTDFSGMGNLQRLIDDIRGGPNAINTQSTQSVLDAIPTPTKLDSVNFARSNPLTQNLVLQGMQEKYGLSPEDSLAQIKNTLPQFQAPTTFGGIRR